MRAIYTEELGDRICLHVTNGLSMRKICEQEGIPDRATVVRWLGKNWGFGANTVHGL